MDDKLSSAVPIACTLEVGDFKQRLAWIASLNHRALLGAWRNGLRLELTYTPQAAEDVREMVRREQQCCAFLDFNLQVEEDAVRLTVTAPETAREAAELLFAPFQSKRPLTEAVSCGCTPVGAR